MIMMLAISSPPLPPSGDHQDRHDDHHDKDQDDNHDDQNRHDNDKDDNQHDAYDPFKKPAPLPSYIGIIMMIMLFVGDHIDDL